MLWGISSVQIFSWSFLVAGQLGVIAHCAGEVVQIDQKRGRELREQIEKEERKIENIKNYKGTELSQTRGKTPKKGAVGNVGDQVKIQQDDGGRVGAPKPKRQRARL